MSRHDRRAREAARRKVTTEQDEANIHVRVEGATERHNIDLVATMQAVGAIYEVVEPRFPGDPVKQLFAQAVAMLASCRAHYDISRAPGTTYRDKVVELVDAAEASLEVSGLGDSLLREFEAEGATKQ